MNARDIDAQINLLAADCNDRVRFLKEIRNTLVKRTVQRDRLRDFLMEMADYMGCSAGNWDGGSVATCEHCQIIALVNATDDE